MADDLDKVHRLEPRLLILQHIGLHIAERGLRTMAQAVGKRADDALLEPFSARMRMHHRLALHGAERGVIHAQHIHLDTSGDQRHGRAQMLRHARRGVQGNRQPDLLDVVIAEPVRFEKRRCRVGAVHFETLVITAVTFDQTEVMEHCADVQQLRVVGQLLALAAQCAEQKYPARVVVEQVGFDVADVLGGGPGEGAVGDFDAGDGRAHGRFPH